MKLKEGFLLHTVGEDHMMVATGKASEGFNGLVRGNDTANFILEQLQQETTEEAIIDAMVAKYNAPRERIAVGVHKVIAQLWERDFLE